VGFEINFSGVLATGLELSCKVAGKNGGAASTNYHRRRKLENGFPSDGRGMQSWSNHQGFGRAALQ